MTEKYNPVEGQVFDVYLAATALLVDINTTTTETILKISQTLKIYY
jgi:hypothetical protein